MPAPGSSVASAPQQLTRRAGHYANPAWSPNGDRLALVQGSGLEFRGQQPEDENFFEIRWLDAGGGETQPVTTVTQGPSMNFHPQAFWSADGMRLLYRKDALAYHYHPETIDAACRRGYERGKNFDVLADSVDDPGLYLRYRVLNRGNT